MLASSSAGLATEADVVFHASKFVLIALSDVSFRAEGDRQKVLCLHIGNSIDPDGYCLDWGFDR
jgi:hypothetical protein